MNFTKLTKFTWLMNFTSKQEASKIKILMNMKQLIKLQNNEIDVDIKNKIDEFNNVDEIHLVDEFYKYLSSK
jgi:hypothetical protein